MTTAEERVQVLKMIQGGQITVEEGAQLLEALREDRPKDQGQSEVREKMPRQLRIQVTDLETGRQKVDVRMPWRLVDVGISMGARFAREEIDLGDFFEAVQSSNFAPYYEWNVDHYGTPTQ